MVIEKLGPPLWMPWDPQRDHLFGQLCSGAADKLWEDLTADILHCSPYIPGEQGQGSNCYLKTRHLGFQNRTAQDSRRYAKDIRVMTDAKESVWKRRQPPYRAECGDTE